MITDVRFLVLSIALVATIFLGYFNFLFTPKIAYVRSSDLVYSYIGMKEAHELYESKATVWKANVDSLEADFQREVTAYQKEYGRLGPSDRQKREASLKSKERELLAYSQAIEQKSKEEEAKITEGVLNQVNAFVIRYGEEHGYDIILGTTVSGSLLYAREGLDITDAVLAGLNESYKRPQ